MNVKVMFQDFRYEVVQNVRCMDYSPSRRRDVLTLLLEDESEHEFEDVHSVEVRFD